MKSGGWLSYHDKHLAWQPYRLVVLVVLTSYGARKGWRTDFKTSPLFVIAFAELGLEKLENTIWKTLARTLPRRVTFLEKVHVVQMTPAHSEH